MTYNLSENSYFCVSFVIFSCFCIKSNFIFQVFSWSLILILHQHCCLNNYYYCFTKIVSTFVIISIVINYTISIISIYFFYILLLILSLSLLLLPPFLICYYQGFYRNSSLSLFLFDPISSFLLARSLCLPFGVYALIQYYHTGWFNYGGKIARDICKIPDRIRVKPSLIASFMIIERQEKFQIFFQWGINIVFDSNRRKYL